MSSEQLATFDPVQARMEWRNNPALPKAPNLLSLHESPESSLEQQAVEWLQPSEASPNPTGIYLINTKLWLDKLSRDSGTEVTVGSVPQAEWDRLFSKYDSIWFMGIYKPSEASRNHAKKWSHEYKYALPDLDPERDVDASPFAIPGYEPNPAIAKDWNEWDQMVEKLHENGKNAFVDFVPNHVGLDHPWTRENPNYFIQGNPDQVRSNPGAYYRVDAADGNTYYLAHGKDPNFPEWHDTIQLNYARPEVQEAMQQVVLSLVDHADGIRCDMAMLLNPSTFLRTWGDHLSDEERNYISQNEFWPKVTQKAKEKAQSQGRKDFYFVAEAYWDKDKLGESFDYIYGKDFYDHLRRVAKKEPNESPENVRWHLIYLATAHKNGRHYRDVLFTENHDEERSVNAFGFKESQAAAVITTFVPDEMILFNQGQEEGRRIRPPMQIKRLPNEPEDNNVKRFYDELHMLKQSRLAQEGSWRIAHLQPDNKNIVAQQYEVSSPVDGDTPSQRGMGAVILTNFSDSYASCRIPDVTNNQDASVYNLSTGEVVQNVDLRREKGIFVGLDAWQSQVVFYAPQNEAISSQTESH